MKNLHLQLVKVACRMVTGLDSRVLSRVSTSTVILLVSGAFTTRRFYEAQTSVVQAHVMHIINNSALCIMTGSSASAAKSVSVINKSRSDNKTTHGSGRQLAEGLQKWDYEMGLRNIHCHMT